MAVKVTELPMQNGFDEAEIKMLTGRLGLTVIVIEFEVAGLFDVQIVFEEVRVQVTKSLFNGIYEKRGLLVD